MKVIPKELCPKCHPQLRGGPRNEFCDVAEFNDYIFQDKCWGVLEYMESTECGAVPRAQRLQYLMAIFSPKINDCRDRLLSDLYISGHKLMKKCGNNLDVQVGIVIY